MKKYFSSSVAESAVKAKTTTSTFKPVDIDEQIKYNRAIESIVWGMPIVNDDLMYQAFRSLGGDFNQVGYWSGLLDWKNQTLTPNPGTIYFMPFINTKDVGPVVLEIPPATDEGSITGNICDFWQCALEDVGPAGVDKGNGGKCLILPPGYNSEVPSGYIPLFSKTFQNYALLRSILKSGGQEDIANAVEYGKKIKLYPLSQAVNPATTIFKDMKGQMFDATITYDLRFFQSLNRMVQIEPWQEKDRAYIDTLASIGIRKEQAFNPDTRMKLLLEAATKDANAWLDVQLETIFPKYYEGGQWFFPAMESVAKGQSDAYADKDSYPVSARAVTYSMGFIGIKHLGAGQYYLYAIVDKEGQPLSAVNTYHLQIPPNAPVKQYWSATLYDRKTHALIREAKNASISSQTPGLRQNGDGSTDLYFGPKAAAGKEYNWIDTGSTRAFELLMRFYGPQEALFKKTWRLPDIEKVEE